VKNQLWIGSIAVGTWLLSAPLVVAQGNLTPPGAPGPTFKTLSQIEPCTAITNSGAVTISQSGSYYLTTNITVAAGNAITITANNVTLDLNGFTIASTEAVPTGAGHGTANYSLSNTNQTIGPIAVSPASGTQIATNHPWANFSF
jgi:hypothetical protein